MAWIDRSGTITSTGDLWFNCGVTAVQSQPSVKVAAGALYESPPHVAEKGDISIIGATTGQAFTCKEW